MKIWLKWLNVVCLWAMVPALYAGNTPREVLNLNPSWKYLRGDDAGAERTAYDDSAWERVGLPHSFSIPYFMSKDFYVGYGWYRREVDLTAKQLKKKIFLEFDGVFQEAEVFVNGVRAGSHVGGYTGFSIDITPQARKGRNVIAVRVNNLWHPDRAPRAGEHVFSGGIYRNVRLVLKSPAYIDWYGTSVTTPDLAQNDGRSSTVRVVTDLCNATGSEATFRLQTDVVDAEGRTVASVTDDYKIASGASVRADQTTPTVEQPVCWSPEQPYLYKVVSTLSRKGRMLDRTETVLGFRWMEWTADKGFFLNGKHLYLRGANVHQDHAGWGDAVTEAGMWRDVRMMKEAGFNFIRGSHYPHSPAFVEACDRKGMLFWSENAFWGIGGFRADGYWNASAYPVEAEDRAGFDRSVKTQLAEMIRIHRNHPSIIAWSMCNEAFFSAPAAMDGVRALLKECVALSRQLDPTRPAAIGGAQRPLGKDRIDLLGDIAGYNGDGGTILDFQQPGIPSMVSEYGSVSADRPGKFAPGWGELQKNEAYKGLPWRSGQAVWCGFDHGSIAGSTLGKMGIVDYFRIPKRAWYWYRKAYRGVEPPTWPVEGKAERLVLTSDKHEGVRTDGTDDVMLQVGVQDAAGRDLSDNPTVTLTVVSGPGEFPTGRSITFSADSDIRMADGKAAIEFRAYEAGTAVVEARAEGLPPVRIEIGFVGDCPYREGVTPVVKERPYVRYVRETEKEILTFGRNNPTFASSQAEGRASGQGADGNPSTYWQAAADDPSPWWMSDTEKGLLLRRIKVTFPRAATYRYRIEASSDKEHWQKVAENSPSPKIENVRVVEFPVEAPTVKARFVRVSFKDNTDGLPAAVSEIEIIGVVAD